MNNKATFKIEYAVLQQAKLNGLQTLPKLIQEYLAKKSRKI